ncbi:hypothetical protein ES288_D09G041200v1 [Gossypium darwinii]|uniref:Uncharacterized protein n=1 Tax=Gossypium darwinii TaxID=34276 RepID=A0A5D2BAA5_GOSDA|nr:hypothetical protein ES288_D09G041200v1 [Gossypium darwinii]
MTTEGKDVVTRCMGVRGPAGTWRGSCEASRVVGTRGGGFLLLRHWRPTAGC